MAMIMLNRELTAREAQQNGLVYKLIDKDFTQQVTKEVQTIAKMPPKVGECMNSLQKFLYRFCTGRGKPGKSRILEFYFECLESHGISRHSYSPKISRIPVYLQSP